METTTNREGMMNRYEIKCDECKTTIGHTDSIRISAAGGHCDSCKTTILASIPGDFRQVPLASYTVREYDATGALVSEIRHAI